MPTIEDTINSFSELSQELIINEYLPTIYNIAFKRRRAELVERITRSSDDVEGLKVYITFLASLPWGWRSMSEFGYTPTGSKFDAAEQSAQLSCHASSAIVSTTEIEATAQGRWQNIIAQQMMALSETFPYYLRGLFWSSKDSKKALAQVASIDGLNVTLDNAGLWLTATEDRCKLLEKGMYLQAYRGSTKVGAPFKITAVAKETGIITIDADPGLADNDVLTFSDIAGLDTPYTDLFPGILDVIDDDNTFQGTDRSSAANADFRAILTDASALTLNHGTLTDFFHKVYDPARAYTNWKIVRKYWQDNIAENVRYTPSGQYADGVDGVRVGRTDLMVDDDIPEDRVIVPDFNSMRIAERGKLENLFNKGWQQVPGRPFLEYIVVWWGLLLARDCRYMGQLHSISLT